MSRIQNAPPSCSSKEWCLPGSGVLGMLLGKDAGQDWNKAGGTGREAR